jgi:hypothetical protein
MRLRQFLGDQLVEYHSGLSPKIDWPFGMQLKKVIRLL